MSKAELWRKQVSIVSLSLLPALIHWNYLSVWLLAWTNADVAFTVTALLWPFCAVAPVFGVVAALNLYDEHCEQCEQEALKRTRLNNERASQ